MSCASIQLAPAPVNGTESRKGSIARDAGRTVSAPAVGHRGIRLHQILEILERADCTSATVARLLGACPRNIAGRLSVLYKLGAVTREEMASTGGRPAYLYSIKRAA